ncbi:MAG: transketolase [Sedimentisphaerales bacterium]|nr:transketolase [Sedimentisphaerales bacterium]
MISFEALEDKVQWAWKEMLKLHKYAPESRIASCLSDIEIFVVLYYGGLLNYDSQNTESEQRDRFIISKGHGAVSLYPILADLNYFDKSELKKIGKEDSFLCGIPDTSVPGFETINGSLGHGLGVACGVSMALRIKKTQRHVFVLCGDGELNEGSVWEAVMFASHHKLDNLILIIDDNKISMLDYQKNILNVGPLEKIFNSFGWEAETVDGHNIEQLYSSLSNFKNSKTNKPKVLIANTRKGKGIPQLEGDRLCHVKSLSAQEIDKILENN